MWIEKSGKKEKGKRKRGDQQRFEVSLGSSLSPFS
jgi:hypothetical protein